MTNLKLTFHSAGAAVSDSAALDRLTASIGDGGRTRRRLGSALSGTSTACIQKPNEQTHEAYFFASDGKTVRAFLLKGVTAEQFTQLDRAFLTLAAHGDQEFRDMVERVLGEKFDVQFH